LACKIFLIIAITKPIKTNIKMKKHLTLIALLFAATVNAQIEKKSVLLGTDLSYISTKEEGSRSTSEFHFAPFVGYFPVDGFVLGVQAEYTESSDEGSSTAYYYSSSAVQKENVLGIGPLFRYYTFFGDKFCLQNALSLYALSGTATYEYNGNYPYVDNYKTKLNGAIGAYNLKAGFLLKESIGLQVSLVKLSFSSITITDKSGTASTSDGATTTQFEFTSLMSAPQIGIEFYIRPKIAKK
jgi:hypothetical protein